ncbi:MAG: DUF3237 domain-containing protein [Lachnospiraceae bacterium]|nr:DUF3237 domain-containing protein [Lachnospiraceae bacterium]
MDDKLLFKINVYLDEVNTVKGDRAEATMILFHGKMDSDFFKGEIINGGVDTQIEEKGKTRTLSARYILKGIDNENELCSIFIENNGTVEKNGEIRTVPRIITDSKALKWLEDTPLKGRVESVREGEVEILFFTAK